MKKFYSLLAALMLAVTVNAQLVTEITAPGVFKLTYGAENDYTFYDPGFEVPTFYVHTWITPENNSGAVSYDDSWANSNVTMNWDAEAGAYVGYIDLTTKVFTNTNNTVAAGTTVQQVGIVFKDLQNGATKQSADGLVVGPTTLPTLGVNSSSLKAKSYVVKGQLYTALKGNLSISVYEMSGKLVKNMNVKADGNAIDLNVYNNGLYLVKVSNGSTNEVVKFAK